MGGNASFDAKKNANENNIPSTESNLPPFTIHESDEFYFQPLTSHELCKLVQSFPSNKAPGWDKVPMSVIKDALPTILPVITEPVNSLLLRYVFPEKWKKSFIKER